MARVPIWKDTYYNVPSSASPYTYSVRLKTGRQIIINGTTTDEVITVFNGKAYVRPGDEFIRINLNHIAQNYLSSDLPDLRDITATTQYTNTEACREFYICDEDGDTAATYNFLLDYSYEDINLGINQNLSEPINGHGTPGMLFLSTAHGGWDSYLIEANVLKTDNYTPYQMNKSYDNTTLDFAKKTYNNQITTSFQMYTGWLKDEEADRLVRNLLSSTKVYVHDLVNDKIYPALIRDSFGTYKTFKNQGHKKVNYQINIEASQTKSNIS